MSGLAGIKKRYQVVVLLLGLIVVWHVPTVVSWMVIQSMDVSGMDDVFIFGTEGPYGNPVNCLDTRVDMFTKDMVIDPPIEFELLFLLDFYYVEGCCELVYPFVVFSVIVVGEHDLFCDPVYSGIKWELK